MTKVSSGVLHFTVTGEFLTQHARELFVEDTPKNAIEFLTTSLIGMEKTMAWDIVLGKLKVIGDSNEGCGVEEDDITDIYGISLSTESVWSRLATQYFRALGELQSLQRRIMILGNADNPTGALYRFCGFEIWSDYIISLKEDRIVYLKIREKFDKIIKQLLFVGEYINKTLADLPIVSYEVPEDISQVYRSQEDVGSYFSLDYLLHSELVEIKLPDDKRKVKYEKAINSYVSGSIVDSYLNAQKVIDKELNQGIKPTSPEEPRDAGWISPNGDYYGLNGDIANLLHNQIASALLEAGIIEESDELDKGNPDNILSREGWVKVHHRWVLYDGYDNPTQSNIVPITDAQLHTLYLYGQHVGGYLELGYNKFQVSAVMIEEIDKLQFQLKFFRL